MSKCAIFTIVQDEKVFLPLWLKYYKQHFAPEDIYVVDHDTTDGSTAGLDVNVEQVHNPEYNDHWWHVQQARDHHSELLKRYPYVMFASGDEFIVPNPVKYPGGLREYVERFTQNVVMCEGREMLQKLEAEHVPVDWTKPILDQRRFWRPMWSCGKTLLANFPLKWDIGCHTVVELQAPQDPDLFLIHLHWVDFSYAMIHHAQIRAKPHRKEANPAWSAHLRQSDAELVLFYTKTQAELVAVPPEFTGKIL